MTFQKRHEDRAREIRTACGATLSDPASASLKDRFAEQDRIIAAALSQAEAEGRQACAKIAYEHAVWLQLRESLHCSEAFYIADLIRARENGISLPSDEKERSTSNK